MPKPVEGTSPYLPGLDGIRAIAVLAVIAYHLNFGWATGGLLGVQVFFVLSGYLITDLLVAEYRRHQVIKLGQFWLRRARRLLPALFVVLFVTVGWATLFDRTQLASLRSDLPSSIFYFSNWWFVFHHISYFARFGPPSPLGHLWSLSIEEQFYLVWPLLVLAGLKWLHSRQTLMVLTAAAAAASAIEMGLLFAAAPAGDPTRVYDGTDTRAFALLIGATLAFGLPRNRVFGAITPGARRTLNLVGGIGLLGIFVMFVDTNQYQPFLYEGGMVLLAVLTAIVIGVTVHPGSQLRSVLGWEPLRWVGERSYAIYLWHYPVIVLTTPLNAAPSILRATLQTGATILLAALSWRYVEDPVRHGALGRLWERVRLRQWTRPQLRPLGWTLVGVASVNAVVCALGLFGVVDASAADPGTRVTSIVPDNSHRAATPTTVATPPGSSTTTTVPPAGQGVTAIGDSIMIDAAPSLQALLPGIAIDAQVGQQLYQVQGAVSQLKAEGWVGNRLILELGTNGPFTVTQLETLLNALGPMQKIVLVNTHVPRPWQQQVNDTIAAVAQTYPNTVMVDWNTDSAKCGPCLYPDGVHLDPAGAKYYAFLLAAALVTPLHPPTHPPTSTTEPARHHAAAPRP